MTTTSDGAPGLADLPLADLHWRQKCVLYAVAAHGPITVARLSLTLGASEATIRSALRILAERSLVRSLPTDGPPGTHLRWVALV